MPAPSTLVSSVLPDNLRASMAGLRLRVMIAEAALAVPEERRTPWDVLRASAALTAQARGIIAERLVGHVLGADRLCPGDDSGDLRDSGRCIEVKSSFCPTRLNVRQIRPWQDADYVVVHAIVEDRSRCRAYRLTHEQMMSEVREIGGVSHGTRSAVAGNANVEYSLTLSRGVRGRGKGVNRTHQRWEEEYRDERLEDLLFGPAGS